MAVTEQFIRLAADGVVYSSIIVLGSIGLSLIYSIAGFANFAHGDTMTVGAYGTLVAFGTVGAVGGSVLGLPVGFFLALAVGAAAAAAVALVTERFVYEPLEIGSIGLLITSIGVAFVYRGLVRMRFGPDARNFGIETLRPVEALVPYGIRVTKHDVAVVASAAALVVGLHLLLQYTDLGRKMRATADPDAAGPRQVRVVRRRPHLPAEVGVLQKQVQADDQGGRRGDDSDVVFGDTDPIRHQRLDGPQRLDAEVARVGAEPHPDETAVDEGDPDGREDRKSVV